MHVYFSIKALRIIRTILRLRIEHDGQRPIGITIYLLFVSRLSKGFYIVILLRMGLSLTIKMLYYVWNIKTAFFAEFATIRGDLLMRTTLCRLGIRYILEILITF